MGQFNEAMQEKRNLEKKLGRNEASQSAMQGRFTVLQQEIKKLKHSDKAAAQANESLHGELMKLEESKKVLLLRLHDSNQNLASKRHDFLQHSLQSTLEFSPKTRAGNEEATDTSKSPRGLRIKETEEEASVQAPLPTLNQRNSQSSKRRSSGQGEAKDLISGANPGVSPEGESKEQNSHERQRESLSVHQATDLVVVGEDANDLNLNQENKGTREDNADGLDLNERDADDLGIFKDNADGLNLNEGDADDLGIFEDNADGLNLNEGDADDLGIFEENADGLNLNEGDADDLGIFEDNADGLNLNEGDADDLGIFEDNADGLNLNEGDADDLGIFEDNADGLNLNEGDADDLGIFEDNADGLNLNEGDADDMGIFEDDTDGLDLNEKDTDEQAR